MLSFNFGEDALEKEMATHSSILTRGITWTEEAGGLSPLGHESDTIEHLRHTIMREKILFSIYFVNSTSNALG